MRTRLPLCLAALSFSIAPALSAQSPGEAEVLAVIDLMFEGLAERDTAKMRTTFEPGARLVVTFSREGRPGYNPVPIDTFLALIADANGPPIEEQYRDPEVRIHDNLATVWVAYTFYVSGEISHCGEDAFQLARSVEGWKIIAIADTQRREGCEP